MLPSSVLLLWAAACAQSPQSIEVPAFEPQFRSRDDLSGWLRAHVPVANEMPWLQRPWHADLANGVEQAWREHKPLALWLGDGHPFGAASATALALKPAWSDAAVRAASRDFVLVADDWNELLMARATSPTLDAWLTRLESEAPLSAGCVYFVMPNGSLLRQAIPQSAAELAAAFDLAMGVWQAEGAAASPPPSHPEQPGPLPRFHRQADAFPLDGLALEIAQRGCDDPALGPPEWLATGWNRDWLWFDADTLQALLPRSGGIGARTELPAELASSFAALLLADSSLGRVAPFSAAEIQQAKISIEPRTVRRGLRGYQVSGELLAERGGSWEAQGEGVFAAGRWLPTRAHGVRARARLTGWMEVEVASGKVVTLQLGALVQIAEAEGVRHMLTLVRRLDAIEDSARLAPSQSDAASRAAAHDERGPLPRRYHMLYAENEPAMDGSLAEAVWQGSSWTEEFGETARAKMVWNSDSLFLGVWSPQPTLELRAQGVMISIAADGVVTGLPNARAKLQKHEDGWSFEIALPWLALAKASESERPAAGNLAAINLRIGGESAAWWSPEAMGGDARVLLEPARSMSFTPGGGFR